MSFVPISAFQKSERHEFFHHPKNTLFHDNLTRDYLVLISADANEAMFREFKKFLRPRNKTFELIWQQWALMIINWDPLHSSK